MKRPLTLATFFLLFLFGLFCLAVFTGLYYNSSSSLAKGFYWKVDQPIKKDSLVSFCQPQSDIFNEGKSKSGLGPGECPGNYIPLMKKVKAIPGDRVTLMKDGIRVNGQLIKNSVPLGLSKLLMGYPAFKNKEYIIKKGEYLLISDYSKKSFDGRYYGPTPETSIHTVLIPFFTW